MTAEPGAAAVDAGDLPLGGGLLALVRPALDGLQAGGVLAVLSSSRTVREDLPAWCRIDRHEYLGREEVAEGCENELAALYVPARFLPRVHPAYLEVAMFLASQLADEARHIDVFLRRARAAGGGLGVSALAAGSTASRAIARGHEKFRELLAVMHQGRTKRLEHAGFSAAEAALLSELHTPNFM